MRKSIITTTFICVAALAHAQTNPAITAWLQNKTITARHYVSGNSTPINDADLVNCQAVQYNSTEVYVSTTGLPSYVTGPFLDGNPSLATNQNAIFKYPLNPAKNTGSPVATSGGNIGSFINGVALFDYRDGVAWNNTTKALCGGPGNPPCPGAPGTAQNWNRDAILAEKGGFDCAKAHPAMGNYHHHQNPSAFNLDLTVISTICNLYNADGLYAIDSNKHSPLIGFAYDGFPIYGAYGYKNVDGTGGVLRIKSSYSLNSGITRSLGPDVSATYPLGYFREDYKYTASTEKDFLDEHNGRFCITPEYPAGIYCYFATIDAKWNSAYPYVVGPTFYGTIQAAKVATVPAGTTTYNATTGIAQSNLLDAQINVFPNPASELLIIQMLDINKENLTIELFDMAGKLLESTNLFAGSTIAYFDTKTIYSGQYLLRITNDKSVVTKRVVIAKE
ncbi:MAG: YHYH protein [bacterium]|nr:YHYH protein [bacterium]